VKLIKIKDFIHEAMTPSPRNLSERREDGMRHTAWVFDFDGTIADTLEIAREVYNDLTRDGKYQALDKSEIDSLRDYTVTQFLKYVGIPKIKVPVLLSKGKKEFRKRTDEIPLIQGMKEVLPELRKRTEVLGILTSNNKENVERVLENHGLNHLFDFISTAPKLEGKARHIRAIAKTYSLSKERILYVGDEVRDVKASRKAGVAVCAVTWGFNSEKVLAKAKPSHLVKECHQLLDLT